MNPKIQVLSKFFNKKYTSEISSKVEIFDLNDIIYLDFIYVNDRQQHYGYDFFIKKQ